MDLCCEMVPPYADLVQIHQAFDLARIADCHCLVASDYCCYILWP